MKPKGRLTIIGGKEDKEENKTTIEGENRDCETNEILKLIVDSTDDRIEVITRTTSEPGDTKETCSKIF